MNIETSIKYMESLKWSKEDLQKAKDAILIWDSPIGSKYIKELNPKWYKEAEIREREHFRNCVKYWSEKLHENR